MHVGYGGHPYPAEKPSKHSHKKLPTDRTIKSCELCIFKSRKKITLHSGLAKPVAVFSPATNLSTPALFLVRKQGNGPNVPALKWQIPHKTISHLSPEPDLLLFGHLHVVQRPPGFEPADLLVAVTVVNFYLIFGTIAVMNHQC